MTSYGWSQRESRFGYGFSPHSHPDRPTQAVISLLAREERWLLFMVSINSKTLFWGYSMIIVHNFKKSLFVGIFVSFFCMLCMGCSTMTNLQKLVTGGSGISDYSLAEIETFIVKGKSTQADIRNKFGEPKEVQEGQAGSTWTYSTLGDDMNKRGLVGAATTDALHASHLTGSSDLGLAAMQASTYAASANALTSSPYGGTEIKKLVVTFDRQGIVKDYDWTYSKLN